MTVEEFLAARCPGAMDLADSLIDKMCQYTSVDRGFAIASVVAFMRHADGLDLVGFVKLVEEISYMGQGQAEEVN